MGSDPDGLGYPVYAYAGNMTLVKYLWSFDGAEPNWLYAAFTAVPKVTFHLDPGEPSRTFELKAQVFDVFGNRTVVPVTVEVLP